MQNRKIIITTSARLCSRWFTYYCLDTLIDYYDVEYWDCYDISYPHFSAKEEKEWDKLVKIHSEKEFKNRLKKLPPNTLLITDIHRNKHNFNLHRLQAKYLKYVVYVDFYTNTVTKLKVQEEKKRLNAIKKKSFFLYCIIKIAKSLKNWNNTTTNLWFKLCFSLYKKQIIISCDEGSKYKINHPDFDLFLKLQKQSRLIPEKFIVFIDDNFPFHPEIKRFEPHLDIEKLVTPFYQSLNTFFRQLERVYNCKVVIAAHPAGLYNNDYFEGRDLIYGKTAELVKDCEAVCIHASNTMSYVTLYDKPAIILHNKAIRESKRLWTMMQLSSELLGITMVDTDITNVTRDLFKKADKNKRKDYILKYFGDISKKHLLNSVLFVRYINAISNELFGES